MARTKFKEFLQHAQGLSKPCYLLFGEPFLCVEFLKIARKNDAEYIEVNKGLREQLHRLSFRSLLAPKKILVYSGRYGKDDLEALDQYFKKPSKYAVLILNFNDDFRKYRSIRSKTPVHIHVSRPPRFWLHDYVSYLTAENGLRWAPGALDLFVFRLGTEYNKLHSFLTEFQEDTEDGSEITKELVKELVEDFSQSTDREFYASLVTKKHYNNRRKNFSLDPLEDLLNSKSPQYVLKGLDNFINHLYQAKYLKMKGILRTNSFISERKPAYDRGDIKFPDNNFFDLYENYQRKLLDLCDQITLREILQMRLEIQRINNKDRPFTTEAELITTIINLLQRRVGIFSEIRGKMLSNTQTQSKRKKKSS